MYWDTRIPSTNEETGGSAFDLVHRLKNTILKQTCITRPSPDETHSLLSGETNERYILLPGIPQVFGRTPRIGQTSPTLAKHLLDSRGSSRIFEIGV